MNDKSQKETIFYVKIFIAVLLITAAISLLLKLVNLVSSSSFKGSSYNILVLAKDAYIIHTDTVEKKILTVKLSGGRKVFLAKSLIDDSKTLGVLLDAKAELSPETNYNSPSDLFLRSDKSRNINNFDVLKIIYYYKTTNSNNKISKEYDYSSAKPQVLDSPLELLKLFGDQNLLTEEKSVEVINSTDQDGLATSVGSALKSVGFNVVNLDFIPNKKSVILTEDITSPSAKRLSNALKIPIKKGQGEAVADITLIIGNDALKN